MARRSGNSSKRSSKRPSRAAPGRRSGPPPPSAPAAERYEAEALPGLVPALATELERLGATVEARGDDALRFRYGGSRASLLELRRAVAVYAWLSFDVPRPKALLGDAHFRRLKEALEGVQAGPPAQRFDGFRFGAAGRDSAVFRRLAAALEPALGLAHRPEDGELLLRVRPGERGGWDVLPRLTPRPLSARSWRVCNLAGGLNATLAVVMNDLLAPRRGERYLNAMCGSGTLLVERALSGPAARLLGCDLDPEALACARANLEAAGVADAVELLAGDATALPFADASFDAIVADLPWGDAVGSAEANTRLYPAFLAEARRLCAPGGRLLVLTHDIRRFEGLLEGRREWRTLTVERVFHGGHWPRMYLLAAN